MHLATGEHVGELHQKLQIWEVGRCRKGPQSLPTGSKSMRHLHIVSYLAQGGLGMGTASLPSPCQGSSSDHSCVTQQSRAPGSLLCHVLSLPFLPYPPPSHSSPPTQESPFKQPACGLLFTSHCHGLLLLPKEQKNPQLPGAQRDRALPSHALPPRLSIHSSTCCVSPSTVFVSNASVSRLE